jgi:hypothetical protein
MRRVMLTVVISLFTLGAKAQQASDALGPGVIVYAQGGAFMVAAPSGWVTDGETGQKLGVCCVFYPSGTSWNDAETIMYPEIAEKKNTTPTYELLWLPTSSSFERITRN